MSIATSSKFRKHQDKTLEESNSLFWGICCESGKKYSQVVCQRFHITMAALEPNAELRESSGDKYVSLMVERAGAEYLLCNLKHDSILQVNLNLLFDEGEDVTFFLKGQGTVHLSGYHVSDSDIKSTNRIPSSDTAGIPTSARKGTSISPKKVIPIIPNKIQISKSPVTGLSKVKKEEVIIDEESSSSSSDDDIEVVSSSLKKEAKKPTKSAKVITSVNDKAEEEDDDDDEEEDDDDGDDEEEEEEEEDEEDGNDDIREEEGNHVATNKVDIGSKKEKPEGPKNPTSKINEVWKMINSLEESSDDSESELSEEPEIETEVVENQKKKPQNRLIQKQSLEQKVTPVKPSVSSTNIPRKSPFTSNKSKKTSDSDKGLLNSSIGRTPMPNKKRLQSPLNESNSTKKMKMNIPIPKKSSGATVNVKKPQIPQLIKTKHGDIEIYDIRQGYGPIAKFGKFVHIVFIGRTVDGTVIANSPETKPFSYKLGCGNVIEGFDIGISGMCVGGKRKIIVPYSVAYGKREEPGVPFGTPLTFIVKLTAVS